MAITWIMLAIVFIRDDAKINKQLKLEFKESFKEYLKSIAIGFIFSLFWPITILFALDSLIGNDESVR